MGRASRMKKKRMLTYEMLIDTPVSDEVKQLFWAVYGAEVEIRHDFEPSTHIPYGWWMSISEVVLSDKARGVYERKLSKIRDSFATRTRLAKKRHPPSTRQEALNRALIWADEEKRHAWIGAFIRDGEQR